LIFAISSSIWFWTAMPWPFSAVLSPSSAVLTANERRELTDGRRAAGCRIEAAKDVDREWEFMALWPSSSSWLPVLAAFGRRVQREVSIGAGAGVGDGSCRKSWVGDVDNRAGMRG
jgi:hypothetical protein